VGRPATLRLGIATHDDDELEVDAQRTLAARIAARCGPWLASWPATAS
jgi:hypothetical protein